MNNLDARRRLLDAAIALMREGETPTTRQLAELAGVNLAAINYYFQGKDNLLAEALDEAATADVEAWLEANLDPETPPRARLETLVHFLARIHRNFHPFAHAQIRTLALHDRPERATERALAALGALCLEQHGDPRLARVQAASLMASVHYLSLFHGRFPVMTGIPVEAAEDLKAYVRDLLASLHLDGDPT